MFNSKPAGIFFYVPILFLLFHFTSYGQKYETNRINVGADLDIRKISAKYLGSPDLWQHILKYNKLDNLAQLKQGASIEVPTGLIKSVHGGIEKAKKEVNDAVKIGARILAENDLNDAVKNYEEAVRQFDNFDYNGSLASSSESVKSAVAAFRQTKEIREKTIDAIISFKKGDVQKRFTKSLSWQNADLFDNLKENDMARTLALSLANITFHDLSQIKLNENSLAVIQSSRYDALSNKTTSKVTLEKGDAYAMLLGSPKKKFDLDISGVKTKINSKYFWVEKNADNTKLANYNGEITLEVKDSAVTVQKNQGSVIPAGGFPAKPTDLLPPPGLLYPADVSELLSNSLTFSWNELGGAAAYWIEISSSPDFKSVYAAEKNITGTSVTISNFQPGSYYWHVCSVDQMGLPGPYSDYFSFVISRDKTKPYLIIEYPPDNFAVKNASLEIKGKTDPNVKLELNGRNVESGADGNFKETVSLTDGHNRIKIKAADLGGNVSELTRDILYESTGEIKITDINSGATFPNETIRTSKRFLNLALNTRPFSSVNITAQNSDFVLTVFADSSGGFRCDIPLIPGKNTIGFSVKSPAGYTKDFNAEVLKENAKPGLSIQTEIPAFTSARKIRLKGVVEDAGKIVVNGTEIRIETDGSFDFELALKPGKNDIDFLCSDDAGNVTRERRSVYFDNTPPAMNGFGIETATATGNNYTVFVKASDETQLKQSARISLIRDGQQTEERMKLDSTGKKYNVVINAAASPKLISVLLEDYAGNAKEYKLSGK